MIVEVDHPAVTGGLKLSYGADGAAGLDGLGRVVDQKWTTGDGETLAAVDRFGYTYDLAGNRLTRDVGAAPFEQDLLDEKYTYDALNRLTNGERGRLCCGDIAASTLSQDWTLDALGNWDEFASDPDGDGSAEEVAQTREHDAANQLTGFTTGPTWVTPAYDAAGNMTLAPKPGDEYHGLALTYDAWNRFVRVSGGATPTAEYQYDGLNRRTAKLVFDAPSDTWTRTDYYFNEAWQVLEERVATAVLAADKGQVATDASVQYLWDPRYIDTPILRWRDADPNAAGLEEVLYYTTDANHNVTAVIQLVDDDEDPETPDVPQVAERYVYAAYGTVTVLNPDWSPRTVNTSAFGNEILFTGHPLDGETGLYYARARYLQPSLGIWLNPDPGGYTDGMNLYQYCGGSSIARTDPWGLYWAIDTEDHLLDIEGEDDGRRVQDYGLLKEHTFLTSEQLAAVYAKLREWATTIGGQAAKYTGAAGDRANVVVNMALASGQVPKDVLNGTVLCSTDPQTRATRFFNDALGANLGGVHDFLEAVRRKYPDMGPAGQSGAEATVADIERVIAWSKASVASSWSQCLYDHPIVVGAASDAIQVAAYGSLGYGTLVRQSTPARKEGFPRANATGPVTWVDEPASMSAEARLYNSSAQGARSNLVTRQPQAPSLQFRDGGQLRSVRFDGEASGLLIDRKLAVVTSPKAQSQALRQWAALRQNGLRGLWEVPEEAQALRAKRMLADLGINNIEVRVVPK